MKEDSDTVAVATQNQSKTVTDKLSAFSTDCAGQATYRYDLASEKKELISMELAPQAPPTTTPDPRITSNNPQTCFEGLAWQSAQQGKTVLTPDQLKAFGVLFIEKCVPTPRPAR